MLKKFLNPTQSIRLAGGENLMFDAASGKQTAQEAADAAVKVINDAIAQKYTK